MTFTKFFATAAVAAGFALTLAGCGEKAPAEAPKAADGAATLSIGVSPVPHADIIRFVEPALKAQGVNLKIVEFSDYVQPNLSLNDKELDANFFQHKPYLDDFNAENNTHIVSVAAIHVEPMGLYGGKQTTLDALSAK